MNFLDLFGEDFTPLDRQREAERRSGPCDDDCESTAPYIDLLPEESNHEEGSPLDFSRRDAREIDLVIAQALRQGLA